MESVHVPVLMDETMEGLDLQSGDNVVDCTVGAGGHSAAILERTAPNGRLLGFDLDEAALGLARTALEPFGSRAMLVRANYRDAGRIIRERGFGPVHAALLDLGFSSIEIDDPARGFSFRLDGPLDMRYDQSQELTAAHLVNEESIDGLSKILWECGEEKYARRIANAIMTIRRERGPITGTLELAEVVAFAVPPHYRKGKIHPATKTFQALRIATNDEFGNMKVALPQLLDLLAPGGRLAVIAFHSLEDGIVKRFFREASDAGIVTLRTKRPVGPTDGEIARNPRSRSAKLRVAIKR